MSTLRRWRGWEYYICELRELYSRWLHAQIGAYLPGEGRTRAASKDESVTHVGIIVVVG